MRHTQRDKLSSLRRCLMPAVRRQATRGEEDAQDAGGEGVRSWNLRRCSATGLDVLSTVFGDSLLALVVPVVQQRLQVGPVLSGGMSSHSQEPHFPGCLCVVQHRLQASSAPSLFSSHVRGVLGTQLCSQVMSSAYLALLLPG